MLSVGIVTFQLEVIGVLSTVGPTLLPVSEPHPVLLYDWTPPKPVLTLTVVDQSLGAWLVSVKL